MEKNLKENIQKGKKISLKKAAQHYLSKSIQTGKHGALEDAKTTMELYLVIILYNDIWYSDILFSSEEVEVHIQ